METSTEIYPDIIELSPDESTLTDPVPESVNSGNEDGSETRRPTTFGTGLNKSHALGWTAQDAFRELYRNWKDALIRSFHLCPLSFIPVWRDLENEIEIALRRPHSREASDELLGYIRFHKESGNLEIANFKASLRSRYFNRRASNKKKDEVARIYSENFKLAALVLRRLNYRFCISASSCTWSFNFRGKDNSNLYIRRAAIDPEAIQNGRDTYAFSLSAGIPRELKANSWEDVLVEIRKGQGEDAKKIDTEEFLSWISVTLDVRGPSVEHMVKTDKGDLILDEAYSGRLYVMGLLLWDTRSTPKPLKFGYNLREDDLCCGEAEFRDYSKVADTLATIWEDGIQAREDLLDPLVCMFQDNPVPSDIAEVTHKFSLEVAESVWAHLVSDSQATFYYNEKLEDKRDPELIQAVLKRRPVGLSEPLWDFLRKHNLIKTPNEQRIHLFKRSPPSKFSATVFALSVHKALIASLALDPRMERIRVEYVQSLDVGLDFVFTPEDSLLQIHEKWLDFKRIHEVETCHVSSSTSRSASGPQVFVCDHVVDKLFGLVLPDITASLDLSKDESISLTQSLRHTARNLLQQMPRRVETVHTGQARELKVNWRSCDPGLVLNEYRMASQYSVALHLQSTCPSYRAFFAGLHIHQPSDPQQAVVSCDCSHQIVSGYLSEAIFTNLDPQETYFAIVTRVAPKALNSLQTNPKSPKSQRQILITKRANSDDLHDGYRSSSTQINGVCPSRGVSVPVPGPDFPEENESNAVEDPPLWQEQDDNMWNQWREQHLSKIFSNLISTREINNEPGSCFSSLPCPNLLHTFTAGEYSRVRLKTGEHEYEDDSEYIIFVHDFGFDEFATGIDKYRLVVTKYSFLKSSTLFNPCSNRSEDVKSFSDRELLLHFTDFSKMGRRQDAEVLLVSNISHAMNVDNPPESQVDTVEHRLHFPQDISTYCFFCRFAIFASPDSDSSSLTPVGSHLLQHRNRWTRPSYMYPCRPAVFDLSPHILGPSEGFSQSSCDIYAVFGFDPARDTTWQVRHRPSLIYDGSPDSILADVCSSRLSPPLMPKASIPTVALISCTPFSPGPESHNPTDRSKLPLANALETLNAVVMTTLSQFIVLLLPPFMIHERFYTPFLNQIFVLLNGRYAVHFKLVHLPDYSVPQARDVLIVLASPVCDGAPWPEKVDSDQTAYDLIRDLSSKNHRSVNGKYFDGFVSKYGSPCPSSPVASQAPHSIYNHQSCISPDNTPLIGLDSRAVEYFGYRNPGSLHPDRGDNLTIRELARLQGFPDDFIFFGPLDEQTASIQRAFPPPIVKMVAETIHRIARNYQVAPANGPPGHLDPTFGARPSKRQRFDVENQ